MTELHVGALALLMTAILLCSLGCDAVGTPPDNPEIAEPTKNSPSSQDSPASEGCPHPILREYLGDSFIISEDCTEIAGWHFFQAWPDRVEERAHIAYVVRADGTVVPSEDREAELSLVVQALGAFGSDDVDEDQVIRATRYLASDATPVLGIPESRIDIEEVRSRHPSVAVEPPRIDRSEDEVKVSYYFEELHMERGELLGYYLYREEIRIAADREVRSSRTMISSDIVAEPP